MNLQLLDPKTKKHTQSEIGINLPNRIRELLSHPVKKTSAKQGELELDDTFAPEELIKTPQNDILYFLDFFVDALPFGDIYLFGGVLRDLAMIGGRNFESDIDIVVDNDWERAQKYLSNLGAVKNKFGGYRLTIDSFEVDVWEAKNTWAIANGYVEYIGVQSLLETTILNWDAILMNWRTKHLVVNNTYFDEIKVRFFDVVLEENPDPLGMAVRVFRHLSKKDAKLISKRAVIYMANCTELYSLTDLVTREKNSYKSLSISSGIYQFFSYIQQHKSSDHVERIFEMAKIQTSIDF